MKPTFIFGQDLQCGICSFVSRGYSQFTRKTESGTFVLYLLSKFLIWWRTHQHCHTSAGLLISQLKQRFKLSQHLKNDPHSSDNAKLKDSVCLRTKNKLLSPTPVHKLLQVNANCRKQVSFTMKSLKLFIHLLYNKLQSFAIKASQHDCH